MTILKQGGKIWKRSGAILLSPDDCCCGCTFCSGGGLAVCALEGEFFGNNGPCVSSPFNVAVLAPWTQVGADANFFWSIAFTSGIQQLTLRGEHRFTGKPSCNAVVGTWTLGTQGNLFEFVAVSSNAPALTPCTAANATVTISRSGDGYLFTVAGMATNPSYFSGPCPGCANLDGAYLAD